MDKNALILTAAAVSAVGVVALTETGQEIGIGVAVAAGLIGLGGGIALVLLVAL